MSKLRGRVRSGSLRDYGPELKDFLSYSDLVDFDPEHPANIGQLIDAYSLKSLTQFVRKARFISVNDIERLSDEDIIKMFHSPIQHPNFKLGGYNYVHLTKQITPRLRTLTRRADANQAPKMPVQKIWAGIRRLDKVGTKTEAVAVSLFS